MFVTVDGPNGVGKTTLITSLQASLAARGYAVLAVREPSNSDIGQFARQHEADLVGIPLASLVVADRYMQLEREIKPALSAGQLVISDRYVAATLVLQRLDGLDPEFLWKLCRDALVPDLSVILTAPARTLTRRLAERTKRSRFEAMPNIAELELQYYTDAAAQLQAAGYKVLILDSDRMDAASLASCVTGELFDPAS